jgi:hypothetical protein
MGHSYSTVKKVSTSKGETQKQIDDFLKNQPIIAIHIHITKGYLKNEDYNTLNPDKDLVKIEWMPHRFNKITLF